MKMIKAEQVVLMTDRSGKTYVYIMKEKTCPDFDCCLFCEEENGNEILAMFEVNSIRQGDGLQAVREDDE